MTIITQSNRNVKTSMALILVVEDEPEVRQLIAQTLGDVHLILEAADGTAALSFVKKVKPHLTILDLSLGSKPEGLEVGQIMDQTPALEGMPILVISGWADRVTISEAFTESGARSFLAKPFTPSQLQREVDKLLEEQARKPAWLSRALVGCGQSEITQTIQELAVLDGGPERINFLKQAIKQVEAIVRGK